MALALIHLSFEVENVPHAYFPKVQIGEESIVQDIAASKFEQSYDSFIGKRQLQFFIWHKFESEGIVIY